MSLDKGLLQRVRDVLADDDGITEKQMVGGRSFMHNGRLCCGVNSGGLLVRVGAAGVPAALAEPYVEQMTMGGRPLDAFVVVAPEGLRDDDDLARWVHRGFADTD